jgi:mycothiol system anti-sigma-R factor
MSDSSLPDRFTCEQAFARVFEFLDRELGPEEERLVLEHLAICEGCTRHFQFEGDLLKVIREKCAGTRAPEHLRRKISDLLDSL